MVSRSLEGVRDLVGIYLLGKGKPKAYEGSEPRTKRTEQGSFQNIKRAHDLFLAVRAIFGSLLPPKLLKGENDGFKLFEYTEPLR